MNFTLLDDTDVSSAYAAYLRELGKRAKYRRDGRFHSSLDPVYWALGHELLTTLKVSAVAVFVVCGGAGAASSRSAGVGR